MMQNDILCKIFVSLGLFTLSKKCIPFTNASFSNFRVTFCSTAFHNGSFVHAASLLEKRSAFGTNLLECVACAGDVRCARSLFRAARSVNLLTPIATLEASETSSPYISR